LKSLYDRVEQVHKGRLRKVSEDGELKLVKNRKGKSLNDFNEAAEKEKESESLESGLEKT